MSTLVELVRSAITLDNERHKAILALRKISELCDWDHGPEKMEQSLKKIEQITDSTLAEIDHEDRR